MSQGRSEPFQTLHHLCIVVRDIESSRRNYEALGIGPWRDYPPLDSYTHLNVANRDAFMQLRYMMCDLENVQLQLCQPPELDCAQRRFLDEHGEGVFHISFETDLEAAEQITADRGIGILASGRRDDGSGFTYFDTQASTGVTIAGRRTTNP